MTSTGQPAPGTVVVTRMMMHELMNHLCIALGNSELLAMDLTPADPSHEPVTEIREACSRAVELVKSWSADKASPR